MDIRRMFGPKGNKLSSALLQSFGVGFKNKKVYGTEAPKGFAILTDKAFERKFGISRYRLMRRFWAQV